MEFIKLDGADGARKGEWVSRESPAAGHPHLHSLDRPIVKNPEVFDMKSQVILPGDEQVSKTRRKRITSTPPPTVVRYG